MKKKILTYVEIFAVMIVLQFILAVAKHFGVNASSTQFYSKMFTMVCMMILAVIVIVYSKIRKAPLSVFPGKFNKWYVIATAIAAILFISTPMNFIKGIPAVLVLFYGSVITPIYEELLFRGFIWNRLEALHGNKIPLILINAFIFGIWHLGYMYTNILAGDWFAVISKFAVGFVFGIILGTLRHFTKNCYSTMLLHGVMNIFL